jgi:hypothetical protein
MEVDILIDRRETRRDALVSRRVRSGRCGSNSELDRSYDAVASIKCLGRKDVMTKGGRRWEQDASRGGVSGSD